MYKQLGLVDLIHGIQAKVEEKTGVKCYDAVPRNAPSPFYFAEVIGKRPAHTKTMYRDVYTVWIHAIAQPGDSSVQIYEMIQQLEEALTEDISLPDTENCRIDIYDGMDNQAMFWQIPTIQAFHSIVPGSVMEFYPTIGVQRDVGSRPDTDVYGLRGLTSCRWLFDPIPMGGNFGGADGQTPEMPGWTYYADQNGFHIWENQYYIPMGFSYDYYITREEYDAVTESNRHLLLLKAIVLSDEQAERYDGILQHADTLSLPETEEGGVPGLSDGTEPVSPSGGSDVVFTYTEEAYYQDCLDRRSMSCSSFSRDNGGFSAVFTSDRERLVFFSVPYESGWSATVNGEPAQVEKVNVGFMAVKVPAGTSEIRFDYSTPGLRFGAVVSAAGVLILILYLRLARRFDRAAKQNGQGGKQDDEANGLSGDSVL